MIVFWISVTNVLAFLKGVDFYIISCLTNIFSFFLLLNTNMSKIVLETQMSQRNKTTIIWKRKYLNLFFPCFLSRGKAPLDRLTADVAAEILHSHNVAAFCLLG